MPVGVVSPASCRLDVRRYTHGMSPSSPTPHPDSTTAPSQRGPVWVWVCAYLGVLALSFSYAWHGVNIWDEGAYPSAAWRILHGQRPFSDFMNYPPGMAWFQVVLLVLFGESLWTARLGWWLLMPLIPLGYAWSARRFLPWSWALPGAVALALAPGVAFNRDLPLTIMMSLTATVWYLERPSVRRALACGTIAGLASLFRWDGCMVAGMMGATMLGVELLLGSARVHAERPADSWLSRSSAMLAGWLLGGSWYIVHWLVDARFRYQVTEVIVQMFSGAYGKQGVPFPEFWGSPLWEKLAQSLGATWQGLVAGRWSALGNFLVARPLHDALDLLLFHLPPLGMSIGVLLAALALLRGERRQVLNLLLLVVAALFSFNQAAWRSGAGNLFKVLGPCYMLLTVLIYEVMGGRLRWPVLTWARRVALGGVIAVWWWHCAANPYGFEVGSPRAWFSARSYHAHPRLGLWMEEADKVFCDEVLQLTRSHLRSGEGVFVAPLAPIVYFILDRPNPSYWEWFMPWWGHGAFRSREELEQEVIAELEQANLGMVFLSPMSMTLRPDDRFEDYCPAISEWISANFSHLAGMERTYSAYRRNPERRVARLAEERWLDRALRVEGLLHREQMMLDGAEQRLLVLSVPGALTIDLRGAVDLRGELHLSWQRMPFRAPGFAGELLVTSSVEALIAEDISAGTGVGETEVSRVLWSAETRFAPELELQPLPERISFSLPESQRLVELTLRNTLSDGNATLEVSTGWIEPTLWQTRPGE